MKREKRDFKENPLSLNERMRLGGIAGAASVGTVYAIFAYFGVFTFVFWIAAVAFVAGFSVGIYYGATSPAESVVMGIMQGMAVVIHLIGLSLSIIAAAIAAILGG